MRPHCCFEPSHKGFGAVIHCNCKCSARCPIETSFRHIRGRAFWGFSGSTHFVTSPCTLTHPSARMTDRIKCDGCSSVGRLGRWARLDRRARLRPKSHRESDGQLCQWLRLWQQWQFVWNPGLSWAEWVGMSFSAPIFHRVHLRRRLMRLSWGCHCK